MSTDFDYQQHARRIMPLLKKLTEFSSKFDDLDKDLRIDPEAIVGDVASCIENLYKSRDLDDEDRINQLEYSVMFLSCLIYQTHTDEFNNFMDGSVRLETDDILSKLIDKGESQ